VRGSLGLNEEKNMMQTIAAYQTVVVVVELVVVCFFELLGGSHT